MKRTGDDVRLVETCGACPEQYDAFIGEERVGYLRLRWGYFEVTCPWVAGTVVYWATTGDGYKGCFDSRDERSMHLGEARAAIARWFNRRQSG